MPDFEIDIEKKYHLPEDISIVNYKDNILVISPSTANWIVLETPLHLDLLYFFQQGHSILEAFDNPAFDRLIINNVVTQLEARRFCSKKVHSTTEDMRSMHIYLTNKCNLFCPHCYMYSGQAKENELTTEEIIKLITDYKNLGGTRLTLSGGEPTIRVDFCLIIKKAAELGLELKLLTNGSLITPIDAKQMARYINSVQISIDGYSEDSNATIRGKGHFQKALNAVESFLNNGVETSVAITPPFEMVRDHIDEYASFAKELYAKYTNKPFQVKFAEGLSRGRMINPSDKTNEEYANIIKLILKQIYEEDYDLITFVETMSNNVILDNCMFGVFSISSNGDVYLCPEIGELLPISNVRLAPLSEIVDKSKTAENATIITKLKPCKDCNLRFICGGGCRTKEFPELSKRISFENIDYDRIPQRNCNDKIKERFYDLMIRSNEYLYTPIGE